MQEKGQAHEGLSLLAQRDGVPPVIIMDNAKEQIQGHFKRKAREMGAHIKQLERYSPKTNAAESMVREVKRGSGRKAMKALSPAKLWDHALELESYVQSNTAKDIYELQGQTPEMIVSGQTSDISPFAELGWYDWCYYWDMPASYPNYPEQLGRWLGPSIDIGPAM